MVSANQLRIGNYIFISILQKNGSFKNELFTVNSTTIRDAEYYGNKWNAEPIPLTEEWLMMFEFEKHIRGYYFKDCGEYQMRISAYTFSGTLIKDSSLFISIHTGFGSQPVTLIKQRSIIISILPHVHQLQNLYFALTGNELQIK